MRSADSNATMLAKSNVCTIERCHDCGTIHLHFGGASVRVRPTEFALLCETMLSALSSVPEIMDDSWPLPHGGH